MATSLSDGTNNASVYAIFVSNNDVYYAGNDTSIGAIVWKNGIATTSESSTAYVVPFSIFVLGTDVYLAGNDYFNDMKAVVVKNGQKEILSAAAISFATSVFVTSN